MSDPRQIGPMAGELTKSEITHTFGGSIWNGTLFCLVGGSVGMRQWLRVRRQYGTHAFSYLLRSVLEIFLLRSSRMLPSALKKSDIRSTLCPCIHTSAHPCNTLLSSYYLLSILPGAKHRGMNNKNI